MPLVPGQRGLVTQQDPDIAALTARLGLRGMQYRSFGNRPVAATPPPEAPPLAPPAPPPAAVPFIPGPVGPAPVQTAPAPAEAPRPMVFPLIAAALGRAAAPVAAPAPDATLVFLGLRTAQGR